VSGYDAIAAADEIARANGWDGRLIGEPLPAADQLYGMASEMGRPVAAGVLPLEQAYAACINATLNAERCGHLGGYQANDVIRFQRHLLGQAVTREETRRAITAHRIKRVVAPLIATHQPRNVLLAEAHGVNGQENLPLTEGEVEDLVTTEVWYSLPWPRRARRRAP
jgi:hypothetical protein